MSGKVLGILEWFEVDEYERVEQVLEAIRRLRVEHLRTGVSWANWHTEAGQEWYTWLLPRLAQEVEILPCFLYTPPSLGLKPRTASPPRNPKAYADFLDQFITLLGNTFEWVELWNEPTNLSEWDFTLDPGWDRFCQMIGGAAHWCHRRGKKTALAGMSPIDPNWLNMMFERGVMAHIDAVGVHGFPGVWEQAWDGWHEEIAEVQAVLDAYKHPAQIWITEAGFSTWQHDEKAQIDAFTDVLDAPVDRIYWYAAQDLAPERSTVDGFHQDEREYHFGLIHTDGTPKLLARIWASDGLDGVRRLAAIQPPAVLSRNQSYTLITGGAGFIGTNVAASYLEAGRPVLIYDNLAQSGAERNLAWLQDRYGKQARVEIADVRHPYRLAEAVRGAAQILHLAGQTSVADSLHSPLRNFEVNVRGTLNLLEAVRKQARPIPLLFASTSDVYGDLADVPLCETASRYVPHDEALHRHGFAENRPLDLRSPLGCAKGAADQYVLDYAHSFDLPTVVLRLGAVYGPHQTCAEEKAWLAHTLRQALVAQPVTLHGDGKAVGDLLFVDDLVQACQLALDQIEHTAGMAFNVGGGPQNSTSQVELVRRMEVATGRSIPLTFEEWRRGDARYYVSDNTRFSQATGWQPQVDLNGGIKRLHHWLQGEDSFSRDGVDATTLVFA